MATHFPVGWYTALGWITALPEISSDGMKFVMPYHSATTRAEFQPYLDAAQAAGIGVYVEIPRPFIRSVDVPAAVAFVTELKSHPAVAAWYLADEPTITEELGPLSADNAAAFYRAIKDADSSRPVVIAFGSYHDSAPYAPAMDTMMAADYPCREFQLEFNNLDYWTRQMRVAASIAANEDDFFPIIQAFSGSSYRLPTMLEARYMVYASSQMGATGMFFWIHDRADRHWVVNTLRPITAELAQVGPAVGNGTISGKVTCIRTDVTPTFHRHGQTAKSYIIAVRHSKSAEGIGVIDTVDAPLKLHSSVKATKAYRLSPNPGEVAIKNYTIPQKMGSYGAHVYRLEASGDTVT